MGSSGKKIVSQRVIFATVGFITVGGAFLEESAEGGGGWAMSDGKEVVVVVVVVVEEVVVVVAKEGCLEDLFRVMIEPILLKTSHKVGLVEVVVGVVELVVEVVEVVVVVGGLGGVIVFSKARARDVRDGLER